LKVLSAEFVTSAAAGGRADGIPRDGLAQIALAGRSNVGKSTLINALCRRKVARTSAAPGKTRLANIYRVALTGVPRSGSGHGGPDTLQLYLVDLPGYGYARGGVDSARELQAVAEAYLTAGKRLRPDQPPPRLRRSAEALAKAERGAKPPSESERGWDPASTEKCRHVLLLIDSRHPGLESDIAAHAWLASMSVGTHIVATKIDKLSRSERARNLKSLEDIFGTAALPVSAHSGEGLNELWQLITRLAKDR
jgi:GTP-binding protein